MKHLLLSVFFATSSMAFAQDNEVWACEFERTALFDWSDDSWRIHTDWFEGIMKVEIDYTNRSAQITRGSITQD